LLEAANFIVFVGDHVLQLPDVLLKSSYYDFLISQDLGMVCSIVLLNQYQILRSASAFQLSDPRLKFLDRFVLFSFIIADVLIHILKFVVEPILQELVFFSIIVEFFFLAGQLLFLTFKFPFHLLHLDILYFHVRLSLAKF
jgi:hypothetical protein